MFLFIYSTIIKTFFFPRNIWDASLVVERVFKSGNREITAVSVLCNKWMDEEINSKKTVYEN